MKRFIIFTVLFPLLAMLVAIAPIPEARHRIDIWMLGVAYAVAIVPAWLSAWADWGLSENPIYVRLIGTAVAGAAAVMAAVAMFNFGEMLSGLMAGLIALAGAIPAAVCSLLANKRKAA